MAKMKIYEIVSSMQRQFPDLQNKDVVTLLQENGFDVKGSQSVIEDDAIGFLLKHAKEHLANLKIQRRKKLQRKRRKKLKILLQVRKRQLKKRQKKKKLSRK